MRNILSLLTGKKSPIKLNAPPVHIGEYSVVREIGSGATSNVYLGIHGKTFASVAIKLLRRECKSDVHRQMFATEASLCGRMDHPNVAGVQEANLDAEDGAYLVMEYIDGQSLDKFSKADALLPVDAVLDAIKQAAEGLKHAASIGIVHRDVKPDNLIRTADGVVKLTDFGCAITNEPNAAPIPVAGSVAYMSPEQLTGKTLTYHSDIYALGAVLYRLLTGRYSFDANTPEEAVQKILKHPHVPVETRRQGIPRELSSIVDKALQKNPQDRHETWDEFIKEISAAQAAMRVKYDYDYDLLRGFSETTLTRFLADTRELAARPQADKS